MICSGRERFFADLLATRRRRIKSEITQHPFLSVDRLLEKAQGPNPGLFRFLGSLQEPLRISIRCHLMDVTPGFKTIAMNMQQL